MCATFTREKSTRFREALHVRIVGAVNVVHANHQPEIVDIDRILMQRVAILSYVDVIHVGIFRNIAERCRCTLLSWWRRCWWLRNYAILLDINNSQWNIARALIALLLIVTCEIDDFESILLWLQSMVIAAWLNAWRLEFFATDNLFGFVLCELCDVLVGVCALKMFCGKKNKLNVHEFQLDVVLSPDEQCLQTSILSMSRPSPSAARQSAQFSFVYNSMWEYAAAPRWCVVWCELQQTFRWIYVDSMEWRVVVRLMGRKLS